MCIMFVIYIQDDDFDLDSDLHPKHNVTFAPEVSINREEEAQVTYSRKQSDGKMCWYCSM